MIVEKRQVDGFTLLLVEGVIKLGESAQFFAQTLERALADDSGHVVIDFSKINYIDSTGIGELVGYLVRFRDQRRKMILVNPSQRITRLLEVAQLLGEFPIYGSVDEVLRAEARKPGASAHA
jgi:anti-sigma B factor antagonist